MTIRSADAAEQQGYTPRVFGPRLPVWAPDKATLMLTGQDARGRVNLYKFELKTGNAALIVANAATVPAFSRDGRLMYYVPQPWRYSDTLFISRVMVRDLNSGRDRQLYAAPRGWRIQTHSVTNDGKTLILVAINTGKRIGPSRAKGVWALSTETGKLSELSRGIGMDSLNERIRPVGFSPDQKYEIILKDASGTPGGFTLWRAPLNGGPVEKLPGAPPELKDIASAPSWLSPDGRRIIFTAGQISSELWVMKDAGAR